MTVEEALLNTFRENLPERKRSAFIEGLLERSFSDRKWQFKQLMAALNDTLEQLRRINYEVEVNVKDVSPKTLGTSRDAKPEDFEDLE